MEEEDVAESSLFSDEDSVYPVYFGVSCAFFVLRLLTVSNVKDNKWSEVREKMLQGSAQLLGLLIWRVQGGGHGQKSALLRKLETTEREVEELKRIRHEDAKANEKVVAIFAGQEHGWLTEKKKLQRQVGALMNELRIAEKKSSEAVTELNGKLKEMELLVMSKDKILEEENQKRKEVEEKLSIAERVAEELRENAMHQAQEHSSELWKHKTAFLELVSNHRQLEAELARTLRQVEAAKDELESVLEQKENTVLLVQNLSAEIMKMRKETEQKDKILLAMIRKSKLDTAQKQILLKEVKLSKAKRKQAEMEMGRWRVVSESGHERQSLRSVLENQPNSRMDSLSGARELNSDAKQSSHIRKTRSKSADLVVDYGFTEFIEESNAFSPITGHFSQEGNEDLGRLVDVQQLESLVLSEAEKYATMLQQRHHQEIDAFTEQMRLKDEKVEAFRWRLLSNELESRRLQSNVEGLNNDILQLKREKMELEALLYKREEEVNSLKKHVAPRVKSQDYQKTNFDSPPCNLDVAEKNSWSKLRIRKTKSGENERERRTTSVEVSIEKYIEKEETLSNNQVKDFVKSPEMEFVHSPEMEFEESEMSYQKGNVSPGEIDFTQKFASPIQQSGVSNNLPWRMDLHALGVSYKIKRLRKQVLMLERLMGKKESSCNTGSNDNEQEGIKDFLMLISLLNKQVSRYLSLQGKTDELCQRMHERGGDVDPENSNSARKKGKTKALENFLEETFQLQRYMVATGQKLVEIHSKISSIFVGAEELRDFVGFDVKFFVENVRSLFQEVQRGLEVRIARIIGDVEGTLACEGMRLKEV